MTRSTVKRLTKPLDEPEIEFRRLRRAACRLQQNGSIAIARRNLFDDKASSFNNTGVKPPTLPRTLHEHSHPNSPRSYEANECKQTNLAEQVCLSEGDIYDDPSLMRLKKQKKDDEDERLLSIFKQIHINLPFLEAMIHMPKGAKVLKDLLSHKEKLEKVASSFKLILEIDKDELVPIILGRPFLATARAVIDVHEGKLSLRVRSETVTFNIGKSMKSKHNRDDYLYCTDHAAKLVQEQWVDTVNHDRK
ncbi:hypothetical protein Tco_1073617 [Tanacetum coccineum]